MIDLRPVKIPNPKTEQFLKLGPWRWEGTAAEVMAGLLMVAIGAVLIGIVSLVLL